MLSQSITVCFTLCVLSYVDQIKLIHVWKPQQRSQAHIYVIGVVTQTINSLLRELKYSITFKNESLFHKWVLISHSSTGHCMCTLCLKWYTTKSACVDSRAANIISKLKTYLSSNIFSISISSLLCSLSAWTKNYPYHYNPCCKLISKEH